MTFDTTTLRVMSYGLCRRRRTRILTFLFMGFVFFFREDIVSVFKHDDAVLRIRAQRASHFTSYESALSLVSDDNKFIMLASVDYGYIDMAINLYLTSIRRLKITNFLLVCSDILSEKVARARGITTVTLDRHDVDGNVSSHYGSKGFIRKTHVKTDLILRALKLGYTVLIVDVDIVFFKNPAPYVQCKDCDISVQSDTTEINSGFYLVKPTSNSIALHARALKMADENPRLTNQKTLAPTLNEMNKSGEIRANLLPDHLFPNGRTYFEEGGRMLPGENPCRDCVLIHNNWIVGQKAKKYRYKEHFLWSIDTDGYYSHANRKYMTYNNPVYFGANSTFDREDAALRSAFAIAHILKRVLILPLFHCQGCKLCTRKGCVPCKEGGAVFSTDTSRPRCYAGVYYNIAKLDRALRYRESSFLENPLVPESVKTSVSPVLKIVPAFARPAVNQDLTNTFIASNDDGTTKEEIINWFVPYSAVSVLRFHSLYGAFSAFGTLGDLKKSLEEGLVLSDYRQYNTMTK